LEGQIVTISFFSFKGFSNQFEGFKKVGILRNKHTDFSPSTFTKVLGSGGKTGFEIWPNWGLYCVLSTFNAYHDAISFHENNENYLNFKNISSNCTTYFLSPITCHGLWDGQKPFIPNKPTNKGKIAVITRGTIKTKKLIAFWQNVPQASKNLQQQDGLLYSIGIGELPVIQQATFSIWENSEKMMNYAYKSSQHASVIKKTREHAWYSEELFARFEILAETIS
jgi:hypothetical protein